VSVGVDPRACVVVEYLDMDWGMTHDGGTVICGVQVRTGMTSHKF